MVLNGLRRAVMYACWTATARRSGARRQTTTPATYLPVPAVSRCTHLTTPATALMIEAQAYAAQAARQTKGRHGAVQPHRCARAPFAPDDKTKAVGRSGAAGRGNGAGQHLCVIGSGRLFLSPPQVAWRAGERELHVPQRRCPADRCP